MVYTHHHFDRAEGAAVFNSTAELIGHRAFEAEKSRARYALPSMLADLDRNGNGALDAGETADAPRPLQIASKDWNGDGVVTPSELYQRVQSIETAYDSRCTIAFGGTTVELVHVGPARAAA